MQKVCCKKRHGRPALVLGTVILLCSVVSSTANLFRFLQQHNPTGRYTTSDKDLSKRVGSYSQGEQRRILDTRHLDNIALLPRGGGTKKKKTTTVDVVTVEETEIVDDDEDSEEEVEVEEEEETEEEDDEDGETSDAQDDDDDEEEEYEEEVVKPQRTKASVTKALTKSVKEKTKVLNTDYDEPLVASPMLNMYVTIGLMFLGRKVDLLSAPIVKIARAGFIVYLVALQVFLLYVRIQAKKTNDQTLIETSNPIASLVQSQLSGTQNGMIKGLASSFLSSKLTAMEYDLKQALSMQSGLLINMGFMWFLHFKMKQVQPLLVQSITGLVNMLYSPLFQVYVLGRNLERPFKGPTTSPQADESINSEAVEDVTESTDNVEAIQEVDDEVDEEAEDSVESSDVSDDEDEDEDDNDDEVDDSDEELDEADEVIEAEEDDNDDDDDDDATSTTVTISAAESDDSDEYDEE